MSKPMTTTDLIATVRRRGGVGSSTAPGMADQDIIDYLNDEMMNELVPHLMRVKEEYFVQKKLVDLVGGQTSYRIPPRAIGQLLRDVLYRDTGSTSYRTNLPMISRERLPEYDVSRGSTTPSAFILEGNYITLVPDVGSSVTGKLEVSFFIRPGALVPVTQARQITAVDVATKTITVDSTVPTDWTTSTVFDVHSKYSGAELHQWDMAATVVSGTTITFADSIATPGEGSDGVFGRHAPEVGDYVTIANEAVIPALPVEFHTILAQSAIVRLWESAGFPEKVMLHQQKLNAMINNNISYTADNRVQGEPKKIATTNSILYRGRRSRSGFGNN